MFKKLDYYIIRKYLGTFFFALILIIAISVVFDFSEKVDNFMEHDTPWQAIVFDYYFNFIPYFANLFIPLFSFIAIIFFTSGLADRSEITAMLAGGMSFNRLLRPYFISALLIGALSFCLSSYIIPPANHNRLIFEDTYYKKRTHDVARDIQLEVQKGEILYIERFASRRNRGTHFSLETFKGNSLVSRLTAQTIQWDSAYHWHIENYMIRKMDGLNENITRGFQLDTIIPIEPYEFFIIAKQAQEMNNHDLERYINKQKRRGAGNIKSFQEEYEKRFSGPFSVLILMVIGVSLSSKKIRGGMGLNIGVGIGISAVFILFQTVSSTFAVKGDMPMLLAVWLPNIVFSFIAFYLYLRAPK